MRKRFPRAKKTLRRSMMHLVVAAVSMGGAGFAKAQSAPPAPSTAASHPKSWAELTNDGRFKDSVDAFVLSDMRHAPVQGGILFVGSSTIRFWENLGEQFKDLPIVRRGFGGSRMADCTRYVDELVIANRPKMVVVYAGDNDLNEGATPQDVLSSYKEFVRKIHKALPDTRIAYISIKPSPSRPNIFESSKKTNAMIEKYTHTAPYLDYIDTYSAMLDARGQPRPELFREDRLHMNSKGYALWQSIIAQHMTKMASKVKTQEPPVAALGDPH